MKKILSNTKMLAALLMAGAAFTACSETDNAVIDQPAAARTYKMTVDATMGEGAQTRGLYFDNTALNVKWYNTDKVSVFPETWSRTEYGTLTAAASENGSTTLTGDLTTAPTAGDHLNLLFPRATWDYTGQKGILLTDENSIEKKYDYALADVTVNTVDGNKITTTGNANFQNQQAIVKFKLLDNGGNAINATSLTISAASNQLVTAKGYNVISRHSGYTYDNGSAAADATSNLVDGNTGTKWCSNPGHKTDGIYFCEFHTASAVRVDGYTLTTGTDNETWNGRNPKDWVLKAKVNSGDTWTTIATVSNDATMEDKNTTPYDFDVNTPGEYQYFRIEISSTRSGDGTMQLGEMQLFAKNYGTTYGDLTVTPTSATSELTVALCNENGSDTYSLVANVGGTTYSYSKSGVNFQNGKYYTVTVKMNNAPQYADQAIEVFQNSDPMLDDYMWGYPSYTHITLNQAYALAKYLGTTTGNTVAVVYDNDSLQVKFALSTDTSATEHQDDCNMLFDYYGYHVYLVP